MLKKFVFIVAMFCFLSVAQAADKDKPLTGSDLKQATEMNDIYARHMYSSTCMERQKALYMPQNLTSAEQAKRITGFKTSCDCLTDTVLKTFAPNDLINYVTAMDGTYPPGVKVRPAADRLVVEKYAKISAVGREIETRKKCGFKQ